MSTIVNNIALNLLIKYDKKKQKITATN